MCVGDEESGRQGADAQNISVGRVCFIGPEWGSFTDVVGATALRRTSDYSCIVVADHDAPVSGDGYVVRSAHPWYPDEQGLIAVAGVGMPGSPIDRYATLIGIKEGDAIGLPAKIGDHGALELADLQRIEVMTDPVIDEAVGTTHKGGILELWPGLHPKGG